MYGPPISGCSWETHSNLYREYNQQMNEFETPLEKELTFTRFDRMCGKYPNNTAVDYLGERFTYRRLQDLTRRFAGALPQDFFSGLFSSRPEERAGKVVVASVHLPVAVPIDPPPAAAIAGVSRAVVSFQEPPRNAQLLEGPFLRERVRGHDGIEKEPLFSHVDDRTVAPATGSPTYGLRLTGSHCSGK